MGLEVRLALRGSSLDLQMMVEAISVSSRDRFRGILCRSGMRLRFSGR